MNPWTLTASDPHSCARAGVLLAQGGIALPTPLFQPVATAGSLKTFDWRDLTRLGYRHVLMNTYHLVVRPGTAALADAGGVKAWTGWGGSVLTDSGGYQVFSLAARRSIREHGVSFTDHIEGARHEFTPESVLRAQLAFGVDFAMPLDICTGLPAGRSRVARDMALTHKWAAQQAALWPELRSRAGTPAGPASQLSLSADSEDPSDVTLKSPQAGKFAGLSDEAVEAGKCAGPTATQRSEARLFGIVQGGLEEDLRAESIAAISALSFDGVAVGGLAVGEAREDFLRLTAFCGPRLPGERVRYLMGVGEPADLLHAIASGFDMFDCVQPTRMARHGVAYTRDGKLPLTQARFTGDARPLDPRCSCYVCRTHSRAYLRHLFTLKEHSYARLLTWHNLHHYGWLMRTARRRIIGGDFARWQAALLPRVDGTLPEGL